MSHGFKCDICETLYGTKPESTLVFCYNPFIQGEGIPIPVEIDICDSCRPKIVDMIMGVVKDKTILRYLEARKSTRGGEWSL